MGHVSLYRKWRPRTFDAVAGQEPVVRTLRRAIETGRVAHAYLFSGPRGTGKTSTAKVLAMGLNCVEGPTAEPDGTCGSCRAIVNNSSMDVLEMDAASNRGIDEIRDLRDKVNLAPVQGRMKVYIIDEVHMLTIEAFNALLKMLEEPPEHVVFILATTEKHKVLPTIISRCQSFDFRRPGVSLLSEKLRDIAEAEGIEVEPEALTIMAREGRGSFRDAEGLLDQLSSFADGPITAAGVRELLGSAGSEVLIETTDALYERRVAEALRIVDRLQNEGKDLSRFVGELVAHLRRLMLMPHAPEVTLAEVGAEERGTLEEQANHVPTAEVVRAIEALGDALSRIKRGGDPKLELELTFLKLARDYTEPSVDALLGRLEALEKAVADGAGIPRNEAAPAPRPPEIEEEEPVVATLEATEPDVAGQQRRGNEETVGGTPAGEIFVREDAGGDDGASGGDIDWGQILQDLRDRKQVLTATVFQEGRPSRFDSGVLEISFPREPDFYLKQASNPRHGEALGQVLEERFGVRPRLEFRVAGEEGAAAKAPEAGANGGIPPARPQSLRDVPQTIPEAAPELRHPGDALSEVAGPEVAKSAGGEGDGIADTIQSQQEVFEMMREWFGPGEKQDGS